MTVEAAEMALTEALARLRAQGRPHAPGCATVRSGGMDLTLRVVTDLRRQSGAVLVRGPREGNLGFGLDDDLAQRGLTDPKTGDPNFDAHVRTSGDEGAALAALSSPVRVACREAVRAGARFGGTHWELRLPYDGRFSARLLCEGVRLVGRAGLHAGVTDVRVAEGLAERLKSEPIAAVRRRALAALLARNAATVDRLRPCLDDLDPEVRLVAAERVGDWGVLLDLVRRGSRTWRTRAANSLARVGPPLDPDAQRAVEAALISVLPDANRGAMAAEGLAAFGATGALRALVVAAREGPQAVRPAAIRAVARLRARLGDCGGGLSLALDVSGRLSVVGPTVEPGKSPAYPPSGL